MRGEHVVGAKSLGAIPGSMRSQYTGKGGDLPTPAGPKRSTIPAGLAFGEFDMFDGARRTMTGTSIFDPVLCELAYRWFCPPGGIVLDPFAGGSVRGIVAAKLGRKYFGIDLSARQIEANIGQAQAIGCDPAPQWICGDSREIEQLVPGIAADFVFSCPPYFDLEKYSDDTRDLSNVDWQTFARDFPAIVAGACRLLSPDRFACFVVGDIRDPDGFYRGLPSLTIAAFEAAGVHLYNEAILVTAAGSLPVRAGKQFEGSRKLGKTHQNVLVFCKGDPRQATAAIGPVEFAEPLEDAPLAAPAAIEELA